MFHVKHSAPPEDWQAGGFGLYVHWPYCLAKCPYCDFNSHVAQAVDHGDWARAFVSEIERAAAPLGDRKLDSIFFGGGTPSLMAPQTVESVIDAAQKAWRFSNDIEITLEANPTSVESDALVAFRNAGVNRVSLGVQALDDADLRRLGRQHSVDEALHAVDLARSVFERVSFDLIYARQHQSLEAWNAELTRALSFEPGHLSLYQLTIEPGTVFGRRHQAGTLKGLPDEDLGADMFALTQDLCTAAGLPAYEVSNHARPGQESRHNMIYWRSGDFVGIGPGAHGRVTISGKRHATEAMRAPQPWLTAARTRGQTTTQDPVEPIDHATEFVLMGLRLHDGIDLERLNKIHPDCLSGTAMEQLIQDKLLIRRDNILSATEKGRPLINAILRALLA